MPTRNTLAPLFAATLALSTALAGADVRAAVVYQQAGALPANTGWTSQFAAGQGGYQSFDDFSLASSAQVDRVSWRGTYFTANGNTLQGAAPNTDAWTVEFWSDSGSGPATQLYSQTFTPAQVNRTNLGTFGSIQYQLYDFEVDLPLDFTATAGQTYWFSVVSLASNFSPFFSWTNSTDPGSTYQRILDGSGQSQGTFVRADQRAFALEGHTVPEPGSAALVLASLLALGAARAGSRQRQAA